MKKQISYEQYKSKVLAGWLGKSLGGVIGAPLENHKQYHHLTLDTLWPDFIGPNDDLDIQMVWLEAMEDFGVYLTSEDLARIWQERCPYNFLDYGYFLYNVQRGIDAPLSGTWNNHFFAESEGCPIRSEIWGYVSPGNMQLAAEFAKYDAELDHGGLSVEIEMFQAAMAANSFFCNDVNTLLDEAMVVLPADSRVPQIINRVREIAQKYPEHYHAWKVLIREFGHRDASKAITNFAIVLLSLFKGQGDFKNTILLCVNSGWDVDCTAATAGALLGTLHGMDALPEDWVEKLGKNLICHVKRRFDNMPLTEIAEATCLVGVEMALSRNANVEITDAPAVAVRPAPKPAVSITVVYPEQPVLWSKKSTPVSLIIHNPHTETISGKLKIACDDTVKCLPDDVNLNINGKESYTVSLEISSAGKNEWLADKNLFTVKLQGENAVIAQKTFGLGGARQWQVYGPYWEMWDATKNAICPFHNADKKCHPGTVGCGSDSYNNYARLDFKYLDEYKLIVADMPDEIPLTLEAAEDYITNKDLGGFTGQACYYFVRTFRVPKEMKSYALAIGRTGPFCAWVNGIKYATQTDTKPWVPWEQENTISVPTNGQVVQRVVVKYIYQTDEMQFSAHIMGAGDPEQKRGVSWYYDNVEDLIVNPE